MILSCPECSARYVVNPKALLPKGRTVRCAKCSHVWFENKPKDEEVIPEPEKKNEETPVEKKAEETVPDDNQDSSAVKNPAEAQNENNEADIDDDFDFPIKKPEKRKRPTPRNTNLPALQNQNKGSGKLGWIALIIFVTAIISGFILMQDTITSSWPASKKLYMAIGLDENKKQSKSVETPKLEPIDERLVIRDISLQKTQRSGTEYIVVNGSVENISDQEQEIPEIKAALLDNNKKAIREWTFSTDPKNVAPGAMIPFETSLPNPPAAATELRTLFTQN